MTQLNAFSQVVRSKGLDERGITDLETSIWINSRVALPLIPTPAPTNCVSLGRHCEAQVPHQGRGPTALPASHIRWGTKKDKLTKQPQQYEGVGGAALGGAPQH